MMNQIEWDAYWAEVDQMPKQEQYRQPSRREQLHEESRTIHKTIMLHFDGIDALTKRQNEIDAEIEVLDASIRGAACDGCGGWVLASEIHGRSLYPEKVEVLGLCSVCIARHESARKAVAR
jgi:hypothetical protein